MTKPNKYLLTAAAILLCTACQNTAEYYNFAQIKKAKWEDSEALTFQLPAHPNPQKTYNLSIHITSNNTYPFRNLWLAIDQNLSDSIPRRDTIQVPLTTPSGKWLGHGTGGLRHLSTPYLPAIRFDSTRTYKLQIHHIMPTHTLKGIEKIGIELHPTETGMS